MPDAPHSQDSNDRDKLDMEELFWAVLKAMGLAVLVFCCFFFCLFATCAGLSVGH